MSDELHSEESESDRLAREFDESCERAINYTPNTRQYLSVFNLDSAVEWANEVNQCMEEIRVEKRNNRKEAIRMFFSNL